MSAPVNCGTAYNDKDAQPESAFGPEVLANLQSLNKSNWQITNAVLTGYKSLHDLHKPGRDGDEELKAKQDNRYREYLLQDGFEYHIKQCLNSAIGSSLQETKGITASSEGPQGDKAKTYNLTVDIADSLVEDTDRDVQKALVDSVGRETMYAMKRAYFMSTACSVENAVEWSTVIDSVRDTLLEQLVKRHANYANAREGYKAAKASLTNLELEKELNSIDPPNRESLTWSPTHWKKRWFPYSGMTGGIPSDGTVIDKVNFECLLSAKELKAVATELATTTKDYSQTRAEATKADASWMPASMLWKVKLDNSPAEIPSHIKDKIAELSSHIPAAEGPVEQSSESPGSVWSTDLSEVFGIQKAPADHSALRQIDVAGWLSSSGMIADDHAINPSQLTVHLVSLRGTENKDLSSMFTQLSTGGSPASLVAASSSDQKKKMGINFDNV